MNILEPITEGTKLWEPDTQTISNSNIYKFMHFLKDEKGLNFTNYWDLWKWSVENIELFWDFFCQFASVPFSKPYTQVLDSHVMPGARWFLDSELNYVANILQRDTSGYPALIAANEQGEVLEVGWKELIERSGAIAEYLRSCGVKKGDRVVGYLPNIPETVYCFLAAASIGAIWSCCSPDFGAPSVASRFQQIEPKVLVCVSGYSYGGRWYDRAAAVKEIRRNLPSLEVTLLVSASGDAQELGGGRIELLDDILSRRGKLEYTPVEANHPLWVLYSSGTTGIPKAIVHSHAGIVVEHIKAATLHLDLHPAERFFWFTTTGWMMWNLLLGGLLVGSTVVLYDGNPMYPDENALWQLAEKVKINFFGVSAAYISACMKAGIQPGKTYDLTSMRGIGVTGSPLSVDGFAWVYRNVHDRIWLVSASGGTDVCSAFVGGCPLLPVHAGEIQCPSLGAKVLAFDEQGNAVYDKVGELVITEPMPSMPVYFWGDKDNQRYRESYFSMYPGVWRHGDWIKFKSDTGGCVIYGRSDSTINRHGVRIGTAEIYASVEGMDEILDSLVVDTEGLGGTSAMYLFVVLAPSVQWSNDLEQRIRNKIRADLSPRHVPDFIFPVKSIPRTLNGKKIEVPVRKIMMGQNPSNVVDANALANPESLHDFIEIAKSVRTNQAI
jgi:acetoacetyl-CoA synthetase